MHMQALQNVTLCGFIIDMTGNLTGLGEIRHPVSTWTHECWVADVCGTLAVECGDTRMNARCRNVTLF